jgi:hypothetical protein
MASKFTYLNPEGFIVVQIELEYLLTLPEVPQLVPAA